MLKIVNFDGLLPVAADTGTMMMPSFTGRMALILLCLTGYLASGVPQAMAVSSANSRHYLEAALIDGHTVQRWNDTTSGLFIYMQPGNTVKGWKPEMTELVKSAFGEWERALGKRIHFLYTAEMAKADVVVTWAPKPKGLEIGHQNIQWGNDNKLTNAEIEISLLRANGKPLNNLEFKYVALHEIGHVLGIRGHSTNPNDVMYATLQPQSASLSARDIATIRALYQQKPEITNPYGIHLGQFRLFNYYVKLGHAAHQRKDHKNAYKYFVTARHYYPEDSHLPYYVGMSAYNAKIYDVAIVNLEKAIATSADDRASAEYYLANSLVAEGSHEMAAGQKQSGLEKLRSAKYHYDRVLNDPSTPADMRKMATNGLNQLDNAATQYR
jgi:tetratricopeptide (TPR) repeat protein